MLYEDEVVDAVADELACRGWTVTQQLRSTEQGDDIVALRGDHRLIVEAKGQTSAVATSARFGQPFSVGQVRSHVGQAVLRSLRVVSDGHCACIALPDDRPHRAEVDKIAPALLQLDVGVFWVAPGPTVSLDPAPTFLS